MNKKIKNVFISHIHEDDSKLVNLKSLLERGGMEIRDSSITDDRPNNASSPEYIKSGIIRPQIEWASTLLVYISPETKSSEWVNWEIEEAYRQEKIIVGVYEPGADGCEAPDSLYACADAIVKWDAEKIIAAINGEYKRIEKPDGTPCNPLHIHRHVCG